MATISFQEILALLGLGNVVFKTATEETQAEVDEFRDKLSALASTSKNPLVVALAQLFLNISYTYHRMELGEVENLVPGLNFSKELLDDGLYDELVKYLAERGVIVEMIHAEPGKPFHFAATYVMDSHPIVYLKKELLKEGKPKTYFG